MTINIQKTTQRTIGLITVLFVLLGATAFAMQGDKISTLSDYLYKKDLKRFEEIQALTDNQKKADQLVAFLKERPISRILLYAASNYMKLAGNNPDKMISMGDTLWDLVPTDQEIQAEAKDIPVGLDEFKKEHLLPTRSLILKQQAAAYFQKQNYAKAAELAEKAYAITPDKPLTQMLFSLYNQLKNEAKIVEYGQKMLKLFPMQQQEGYTTALQLADIYIKQNNANAAIQLFTKLMDVYGNSVPPNMPEANWNQTRIFAYSLMARDAYAKKNYSKAESMFQTVLSFNSQLDEPYYYLGMCKWKAKDQQSAIVYFARCFVLNKTFAAKANEHLQSLYPAQYPNEPDGLGAILDQAKKDLGIN